MKDIPADFEKWTPCDETTNARSCEEICREIANQCFGETTLCAIAEATVRQRRAITKEACMLGCGAQIRAQEPEAFESFCQTQNADGPTLECSESLSNDLKQLIASQCTEATERLGGLDNIANIAGAGGMAGAAGMAGTGGMAGSGRMSGSGGMSGTGGTSGNGGMGGTGGGEIQGCFGRGQPEYGSCNLPGGDLAVDVFCQRVANCTNPASERINCDWTLNSAREYCALLSRQRHLG